MHKFAGGRSEGVTPVPIPNTEVKTFSADDTAPEAVWESRSSPALIYTKKGSPPRRALFLFTVDDWRLGARVLWSVRFSDRSRRDRKRLEPAAPVPYHAHPGYGGSTKSTRSIKSINWKPGPCLNRYRTRYQYRNPRGLFKIAGLFPQAVEPASRS